MKYAFTLAIFSSIVFAFVAMVHADKYCLGDLTYTGNGQLINVKDLVDLVDQQAGVCLAQESSNVGLRSRDKPCDKDQCDHFTGKFRQRVKDSCSCPLGHKTVKYAKGVLDLKFYKGNFPVNGSGDKNTTSQGDDGDDGNHKPTNSTSKPAGGNNKPTNSTTKPDPSPTCKPAPVDQGGKNITNSNPVDDNNDDDENAAKFDNTTAAMANSKKVRWTKEVI